MDTRTQPREASASAEPVVRTAPGRPVKLAVLDALSAAAHTLEQPGLDDEAVHDIRKKLKRARAGIRLLRPVDERIYESENQRVRDAGQRLSGLRDAKVLLGAVGKLLEKEKKPARRWLLERLRVRVEKQREREWRAVTAGPAVREIAQALHQSAGELESLPFSRDGTATLASALDQLYRKGRKALKRSRRKPTDECLHEARKQAKHLANAMKLLVTGNPPKRVKKALHRASALDDKLGDDHDLAVVQAALAELPRKAGKGRRSLRRRLEKRRAKLQKKALAVGGKLFRRKTRDLLRETAAAAA